MGLPFLKLGKSLDQVIVVDLGTRTSKAILLHKRGIGYSLSRLVMLDAPVYERSLSVDLLSEHLKQIHLEMGGKVKNFVLILGVGESFFRQTEMPMVPVSDMRRMLKLNPKNYLQQDLPDHVFDCYILPPSAGADEETKPTASMKVKVLVAGARRELLGNLQAAAKGAGLVVDYIVPGFIAPPNAFELASPDTFQNEVVALVDLGFKNSTILILSRGELKMSRVVGIGGDKVTHGLAETMGISYAEAEGIKIGMPHEVQATLEPLISPLARELRASIDFFEHQEDQTVSGVYLSGGMGHSELINEMIQSEVMVPCQVWNPTSFLTLALPAEQMEQLDNLSSQLTVAVGAGISVI